MSRRKALLGIIFVVLVCFFIFAFLIINYVKPKYETGIAKSLNSINELKAILESFPSVGEIKYIRRTQAGTVGLLFAGKALPEKVEAFCKEQNCIIFPAKEYQHVWQSRLSLYKATKTFFISDEKGSFHFDGPESLRNNQYRVSFFYMPNKQLFIGEVFFFH